MRIFDVTIRVKAETAEAAEITALGDLLWDSWNDEPMDIWYEVVGVAEKVGE